MSNTSSNDNQTALLTTGNILSQGWVGQCNQRGTIDIILACFSTIFISLWVMLHLNVPASDEGIWTGFFRKVRWLLIGALAPEILLLLSGGQWASARRSSIEMQAMGHKQWTMVHGFYADSGGFMLKAPDAPAFPVTARQIQHLVESKYMAVPNISEDEIFDKSKADQVTKIIAYLQTGWFVTKCIARGIQHLPVSPMEISTCAIVFCSIPTYFFWLRKPLNVLTPTILTIEHNMAEILIRAGAPAQKPYRLRPMDFVEPFASTFAQWPQICKRGGPYSHPLHRLPNDRSPDLYSVSQQTCYALVVICFSTSSFIEWHFNFPTYLEQRIWRIACVVAECTLFTQAVLGVLDPRKKWHSIVYTEGYQPNWPWDLLCFVPVTLYFCARLVLVGLGFSALRSLPLGSYVQIEWLALIPHI